MKLRVIWMIIGALAIAGALYFIVQLSGSPDAPDSAKSAENSDTMESGGIKPLSFSNVSEFVENGRRRLRVSGQAEPGSVVAFQDRGERLRQVRTNEQGEWGVTIDSDNKAMVIEAMMYNGQETVTHRAEETIFRIPTPNSPEVAASEFITPALIMVSAPGSPTRIIQSPFGGSPTSGPLTIGAVDYDDTGGLIISGTTSEAGRVRLYAGRAAIGETRVGVKGRWNYIAGNMLPFGEYPLRAELIRSSENRVQVAVPFERLPPLADASGNEGALSVNFEPYRWQVRRTLIGGGTQSTVIFSPNVVMPEDTPEPDTEE